MPLFDDEDDKAGKPKGEVRLGEDLERYSREELEDRIVALKSEIARIEQAIASKSDQRSVAESLFKL